MQKSLSPGDAETAPPTALTLNYFSNAALKKIATSLGVLEPDRPTQTERIAQLIGSQRHHDILARALSDQEWEILTLLPLGLGEFRIRVLMIALWDRGASDAQALNTISRLLSYGCLLPLQGGGWNQSKLGIEAGAISNWAIQAVFALAPGVATWAQQRSGARKTLTPVEPPATIIPAALGDLQRAAFVLLTELGRKPLRLTGQGTPNKTDLRRLVVALNGGGAAAKRQAAGDAVPTLLYFVIAVLAGVELLHLDDRELSPCPEYPEFLQLPSDEQAHQLLIGWCRSRFDDFAAIPTLAHAYYPESLPWSTDNGYHQPNGVQLLTARVALADAISRLLRGRPDGWFRSADLATYLHEQFPEMLFNRVEDYSIFFGGHFGNARDRHRAYPVVVRRADGSTPGLGQKGKSATLFQDTDWMEVEGAFVRQVLGESMRLLGLVEVGPDAAGAERFRITPLGRTTLLGEPPPTPHHAAGRSLIVQPNFEIVVMDAMGSFGLLAQLDAFAERRALDRAATYRLTQAALVRGLDAGWTGAGVVETLEGANGGSLPQNVRYTLDEWVNLYERLTLHETAHVLEADWSGQLDRFFGDRKLAPLLGARLGPATVLVPAHNVEAVVNRVAALTRGINGIDYSQSAAGMLRLRDPDQLELDAEVAEPYLRYRLGAFAAVQSESASHVSYRVSRESVARAAENGTAARQIVPYLAAMSGKPLPPDLRLRLLAWGDQLPPLRMEAFVAVTLPAGVGTWEELLAIKPIACLIRAVTSPTTALVHPADLDGLREQLAERGLGLSEAEIAAEQLAHRTAQTDLRSELRKYKSDPEAVRDALKAAGLLGKLRSLDRGWYS